MQEERIFVCQLDTNNKIMITVDKKLLIVWDLCSGENCEPLLLRIIYPYKYSDIKSAGLSSCGKYILTASSFHKIQRPVCEDCPQLRLTQNNRFGSLIKFWEWSYGRPKFDGNYQFI